MEGLLKLRGARVEALQQKAHLDSAPTGGIIQQVYTPVSGSTFTKHLDPCELKRSQPAAVSFTSK